MNFRRCLPTLAAAILCAPLTISADEAVNKLMASHEQALRSARLPIHRKLLGELQKLQSQHQKSGNKIAQGEVEAEIARVKQWMADAAQPVGGGAGPQPADFRLSYHHPEKCIMGAWENGELKVESTGFTWVNKGPVVEMIHTKVLTGAFEAEIVYKGGVYAFSGVEADWTKFRQMYVHPPNDGEKHTIKVKRSAAGALSGELDGKPFVFSAGAEARPDMHLRLGFTLLAGATVEVKSVSIKDLSAK